MADNPQRPTEDIAMHRMSGVTWYDYSDEYGYVWCVGMPSRINQRMPLWVVVDEDIEIETPDDETLDIDS